MASVLTQFGGIHYAKIYFYPKLRGRITACLTCLEGKELE